MTVAIFYFDWRQVWIAIKNVNPWFLPLFFVIYVFDFYIRAYRWKLILFPVKSDVSFIKLFYSYNIAYFANVFLPARLGELLRVIITGREESISKRTILGTLFVERVFDIFGMGLLIFLTFLFLHRDVLDYTTRDTMIMWSFIFIAIFAFVVISVLYIKHFDSFTVKVPKLRKAVDMVTPFYKGLLSLKRLQILFFLSILSFLMWVFNAFILYVYILALSFDNTFLDSVIVLLFQLIGEFIPSAPSSIGTFHASTVLGGKFIGLSPDQGLVLGILNHTVDLIIRFSIGLVSISLLRFNFFNELKKLKNEHNL